MKEININIEGYNVNGICVGCLHYRRKMFYHKDIKECFKTIGNIDVPDGLDIQLCWECLWAVKKIKDFQQKILKSYDFLINYSMHSPFLNSPEDFTKHADTSLCVSKTILNSYPGESELINEPFDEIKDDIKIENDSDVMMPFDSDSIKEEPLICQESQNSNDFTYHDTNITSDEDVQLSKLKKKQKKKEKRHKKAKLKGKTKKDKKLDKETLRETELVNDKTSRKLKNLPSDLVVLYAMTEDEMWQVRATDVASEGYIKLKYRCDDCIIAFNTAKQRDEHLNGKHRKKGEDDTQCDVCKAYFVVKENMSAHRSLHANAYHCLECGLRTTLKRLMMRHPCIETKSNAGYKCRTCNNIFSTKSKLTYHRIVCEQERPQCDCCGKVFANKMTLKYHLKILPQNKDEKSKEKCYIPCKGCHKVFHSKKSYRAHVVIHDGVTYPCAVCGKLFRWKRNLARHLRNHRERDAGAAHECRDCAKTFASRDCYNNHMRFSKRHADELTYAHECKFCGKKFPTKWCMVDHVDWHHLERIKYRCSHCLKPFKTAKILVAHIKNIHRTDGKKEEDGEHLCDICGKSYKTVKRLKSHVWSMHTKRSTGSNTYRCKLCPATFTWQTSIYKHMKMMHDTKRSKPPRTSVTKKQDVYPILKTHPIDYFQQNLVTNLAQNIDININ